MKRAKVVACGMVFLLTGILSIASVWSAVRPQSETISISSSENMPQAVLADLNSVSAHQSGLPKPGLSESGLSESGVPESGVQAEDKSQLLSYVTGASRHGLYVNFLLLASVLVLLYVVVSLRNTAQRERQKRAQEKWLAEKNAETLKRTFLDTVNHELRTPLNGVKGMLTLLQTPGLSDERRREYIVNAQDAADDLAFMVENLLDYSLSHSGMLKIENQHVDLSTLLEKLKAQYLSKCAKKGLLYKQDLVSELPTVVSVDVTKLQAVLQQLLINAIRFTDYGSVCLQVDWQAEFSDLNCDGFLLFTLTDTGIGIRDKTRIFEEFYQENRGAAECSGGIGIGLSYCKQLAKLMQAQLDLDLLADGECGSRFTLKVPVRVIVGDIADTRLVLPEVLENPQVHVLVVEDNTTNIMVLEGMLKKMGVNVISAMNGRDAIAILQQINVNAIMMDCQMPVMNGFDTTTKIRSELKSTVPIIAVTANNEKTEKTHCFSVGMNDFIQKPLDLSSIETALNKWVYRENRQYSVH